MAFLDLNAPSAFAARRTGVVLRIHEDWLAEGAPAEVRPSRLRLLQPLAAVAAAACVDVWATAALGSQLLGIAATGVIAALVLSLLNGLRR